MPTYSRSNARLSYPILLDAVFYTGGVLYDPYVIDHIEIWKFAESSNCGGILVDTISGLHAHRTQTGYWQVIYEIYNAHGSPLPSPAGATGHGSPLQGSSPNDPTDIVAGTRYFDKWFFKPTSSYPLQNSVGSSFYLYPDSYFVDNDASKFRFELKLERKLIVKGENLDVRLEIIPIPLYRALREPIVNYILPISTMRARLLDGQYNAVIDWAPLIFTGKEGIFPTSGVAALQLGAYFLQVELTLPNAQVLRFPRQAVQLID